MSRLRRAFQIVHLLTVFATSGVKIGCIFTYGLGARKRYFVYRRIEDRYLYACIVKLLPNLPQLVSTGVLIYVAGFAIQFHVADFRPAQLVLGIKAAQHAREVKIDLIGDYPKFPWIVEIFRNRDRR